MTMRLPKEVTTKNAQETIELAKEIAGEIEACEPKILCLEGNLGTGKTTFVKGFCDFYGVGKQIVKSPTYTYYRLYNGGKMDIYHFDYYRLTELDEIVEHEFLEIMDKENSIVLIEWPEKVKDLMPKGTIFVDYHDIPRSNIFSAEND